MENEKSEVDKLFEGLPSEDKQEQDIFGDRPKGETPIVPEKDIDEPHKNRRHRRLEEALQTEREARIAAEARAQALLESNLPKPVEGDVDPRWLQMYGDTPEARKAWQLQKDILTDYGQKVREETLYEIETRQRKEVQEQSQWESFIGSNLEAIEDQFNVDVTSNSPSASKMRREFLSLVENLSPKDGDGNITNFADFNATWEMYQSKQERPDATRNKDIASRSMNKGGSSPSLEKEVTPGFFGWKKDLNISG